MDIDSSLLPATTTVRSSSSSGGCTDILGRSNTPSFSYFKDWKFNYGADLKAKEIQNLFLLDHFKFPKFQPICRITRLLVFLIFSFLWRGRLPLLLYPKSLSQFRG
ncbi:hypothetical protein AB3S75_012867 [Citrus x aurantiifolia]